MMNRIWGELHKFVMNLQSCGTMARIRACCHEFSEIWGCLEPSGLGWVLDLDIWRCRWIWQFSKLFLVKIHWNAMRQIWSCSSLVLQCECSSSQMSSLPVARTTLHLLKIWTHMIRITWTQLRSMLICTRTWQIMIALYFVVLVSSTQIVLALQSIHPDEISWLWRVWTCLVYLRPLKLLQASIMFGHLRCQAANANVGIEQLTNKEQTAAISEHRGVASCNWNCNISLITGIFPEHFRTGQRGHNSLKLVIWAISLLEIHKKSKTAATSSAVLVELLRFEFWMRSIVSGACLPSYS